MFDIGFPELIIVSIVALLVIGPEKLPETIRTLALWMGRLRRSLANIKMELENEIGADEIRRQIHNESIMKELDSAKREFEGIVNDTNSTISEIKDSAKIDTTPTKGAETTNPTNEIESSDDGSSKSGRQSESGT